MTRPTSRAVALYACLSAVYLLYLPHALPVLDDWTYLRAFEQAHAGGITGQSRFLARLIDNTWLAQFRIFWTGVVPVYVLSAVAGFSGWAYFLLAWLVHLATAVVLSRLVSSLAADEDLGFAAGAIYAAFPPANNVLFWPVSNSFYYFQALALLAWLQYNGRRLAGREDFRFRVRDLLFLAVVAFTGEQILPALILLPLTWWLFTRPERRGVPRSFVWQAVGAAVLLGAYTFIVNRMPIVQGFHNRYSGGVRWSPWPVVARFFASLGFMPDLAEWRPAWRPDAVLVALLGIAMLAFIWGARRFASGRVSLSVPAKLLLWSLAGAALTYAPVALLPGIEWRYLYVPSMFLASGAAALLRPLRRPIRVMVTFAIVAYGLSLTYFEMRQCWIPQSQVARAMLDAVRNARPVRDGAIFVFARAPHSMGPAPSFIAGASWSLKSMLEHYTGAAQVQGARELLANENGEMALYNRDSLAPFTRPDFERLRVFVREPDGRFTPKSFVTLPAPGQQQVVPLQGAQGPSADNTYVAHPHTGPLHVPGS